MAEGAARLGLLLLILTSQACARDPAMVGWEKRWLAVERELVDGDYESAAEGFDRLAQSALKPVDRLQMRFQQARALAAAGHHKKAIRMYRDVAIEMPLVTDRARVHYELARLAEELGYEDLAIDLYRRLVVHYPDLMPGVRALSHLERIQRARGTRGLMEHLRWGLEAYPRMRHTELADNFIYRAANEAYRRWKATGRDKWADIAERLYERIHQAHFKTGTWDDALWELSRMYHRQRRFSDEIRIIRRIQATREVATFIGNYEHEFYWVGQLRIARVQLVELKQPREAAASYQWFIDNYPMSRWLDDALYWQGCAWLRAGERDKAEASFAKIPAAWEESKYLRRLADARTAPQSAICDPKPFPEGEW